MSWTTLQQAVRAWLVAGTQIPAERIIWARQNGPRPAYPFATLDVISDVQVGQTEPREVLDAGKVVTTVYQNRRVTIQAKVYTQASGNSGSAPVPARQYLSRARAALDMPSRKAAFVAADIALNRTGAVLELPEQDGDRWLSVAALEVVFNANEALIDPTGNDYVETVAVTGTDPEPDPDKTLIDETFGVGYPP